MKVSGRRWSLAFAALSISSSALAEAGDPAAARLEAYDQAVVGVMKQGKQLRLAGRQQKFVGIVAQYYDVPAMAALVTGPAWATTAAADKTAFIAAFTQYSAHALATNFTVYGGEKFIVNPKVQRRGNDAIVSVRIISGGDSTPLVYRTRGGRIIDVYAKGVSQISLQRSDFTKTVSAAGVSGLTRKLNDTLKRSLVGN